MNSGYIIIGNISRLEGLNNQAFNPNQFNRIPNNEYNPYQNEGNKEINEELKEQQDKLLKNEISGTTLPKNVIQNYISKQNIMDDKLSSKF